MEVAAAVVERVQAAFDDPVTVDGHELRIVKRRQRAFKVAGPTWIVGRSIYSGAVSSYRIDDPALALERLTESKVWLTLFWFRFGDGDFQSAIVSLSHGVGEARFRCIW